MMMISRAARLATSAAAHRCVVAPRVLYSVGGNVRSYASPSLACFMPIKTIKVSITVLPNLTEQKRVFHLSHTLVLVHKGPHHG